MTRWLWAAGSLLTLVSCGDEVVGFAEAAEASSSTSATTTGLGSSSGSSEDTSSGAESTSSGGVESPLPDYVAYGFEASVAVSFDDGVEWVDAAELADMPVREGLVAGEDRIVLVGGDRSATTFDGLAWSVNAFGFTGYARDVAHGAGRFVSVGLDQLAWSDDAQSWSDARGEVSGFDLVAATYGDGRFVAVGVDQLATSQDGEDWTLTPVAGEKLISVAYGDDRFVAIGELGRILETRDGVTVLRDEDSGMTGLGAIRVCDDAFVVSGADRYWLSPDAATWSEVMTAGEGAFACSGTSWVIAKTTGLYWAAELGPFDPAYTAQSVFYEVEFTGLAAP